MLWRLLSAPVGQRNAFENVIVSAVVVVCSCWPKEDLGRGQSVGAAVVVVCS